MSLWGIFPLAKNLSWKEYLQAAKTHDFFGKNQPDQKL
jgi:hypothetical protein